MNQWIWIFLLLAQISQADFKATIYEKDSAPPKALFTIENTQKDIEGGFTESLSVTKNLEGEVITIEKALFKGESVLKYEMDHKQIGKSGTIEVKDKKIQFKMLKEDKSIKTDDEDLTSQFIVPMSLIKYVQKNWEELKKGKEVEVRLGVWDRLETVGFTFKKIEEKDSSVTVRMKPSSFAIALLVNPLVFVFNADGSQLLKLTGRVQPKIKSGSSFKDLDADVVYTH